MPGRQCYHLTIWYDTVPLFCACEIWVINMNKLQSNKTILFDILDFWCQLEVIRFVKTLSKRRMFISFMKISACWLLHRLMKFNKICWEKRPAHPRPNMRTSFCRGDLKDTQPHLKIERHPVRSCWAPQMFKLKMIQSPDCGLTRTSELESCASSD